MNSVAKGDQLNVVVKRDQLNVFIKMDRLIILEKMEHLIAFEERDQMIAFAKTQIFGKSSLTLAIMLTARCQNNDYDQMLFIVLKSFLNKCFYTSSNKGKN